MHSKKMFVCNYIVISIFHFLYPIIRSTSRDCQCPCQYKYHNYLFYKLFFLIYKWNKHKSYSLLGNFKRIAANLGFWCGDMQIDFKGFIAGY